MPGQPHGRPTVNLLISLAALISPGLAAWWGPRLPRQHSARSSRGERD
jgi:hypothetical protein